MLQGWVVVLAATIYIGLLFAVASFGDRAARRLPATGRGRPTIYSLSLAVYCTSWTFFGSVGLAASTGLEFLTIYLGPILMIGLGYPIVQRIVRLAKAERITSVADFLAARYGNNEIVAGVATLIAVIGTLPYISLQLKAVSTSVIAVVEPMTRDSVGIAVFGDISVFVALSMALFAILFGTRHVDATEHQEGLMLAVAAESAVKLVAFLSVGIFVTFFLFDGPVDLFSTAAATPGVLDHFGDGFEVDTWIAMTLLSLFAILLLPRQFHVTVVENNADAEIRRAAWLFPLYLVLINLFVVPIAVAGKLTFGTTVDADSFVVALPMSVDDGLLTMAAFIGGLSAATAMVIVACVALSIMVSNNIVVPLLLRHRLQAFERTRDPGRRLLLIRRCAILGVMLLAYAYFRVTGSSAALASIGLLSFAAAAQFAPAFFGGLVWRRANARGAIAGLVTGFVVWAYTLLLPAFADAGLLPDGILADGPFGIAALRPQALFGAALTPLAHGVFWSLAANLVAFVVASLTRRPQTIERLQANVFVPRELMPAPSFRLWGTMVTAGDLMDTAARYVGAERAERSFRDYAEQQGGPVDRDRPADIRIFRFTEQLLTSAIGASSSRIVLSLLTKRRDPSAKGAFRLLDDASAAIQYNRDLLQTAIDQVAQGIAVFDADLRLVCWNRRFRTLLNLPDTLGQVGTPLPQIVRYNAERGEFGPGTVDAIVGDRIDRLATRQETFREILHSTGTVLEVGSSPMPSGGIVVTYTDITEQVKTEETLELRVRERTEELTRVNEALSSAKAEAEAANTGKTRFLAGAGHDLLQPLNAARLYATSLVERIGEDSGEATIAGNIDTALEAVEEIISAVIDISRLDTGALKPEFSTFRLGDLLADLAVEFAPLAADKGLKLTVVPSSLVVRSDRRLTRRLLQNLIANAVKYTRRGRVLIGCRRRGDSAVVSIYDTGPGIALADQRRIFEEFQRLNGASEPRGLGLGLSIVERLARVLDHEIGLVSAPGRGAHFSVTLPRGRAADLPARPDLARQPPIADIAGTVVLCLDNEPQILSGFATLLGGWGCVVLPARSTAEAEAAIVAAGRRPDIAIVDFHLDDGDGLAAVAALRRRFDPQMNAILITADRSPAIRAAAAAAEMPLINKPVRPAALRAAITRLRAVRVVAAE